MRAHRQAAFLSLTLLVLGCGTKPGPDAGTPPGPAPAPALAPITVPPPGGPLPADAAGIEGTYLVVGTEMFGEKTADEKIAKEPEIDRTVKINKSQIQIKTHKREVIGYKLDPSKSPKEIDLFSEEPGKKSKASHGIYKVEGNTLTLFLMGANEPRFRPREFKTLDPFKAEKGAKEPAEQVGGFVIMVLKKVSDDTVFIAEAPSKPKPPTADEDGPVVAELTKLGFVAEKVTYGTSPGVNVTVPSTLPPAAVKELSGRPRIRAIMFQKKQFTDPGHPVTDEAVRSLTKLDGLTVLSFESCPKITAAAFRDLGRFPALTGVKVTGADVDDAVTEELTKVKTLELVDLDGAKLTDKALANLAKVKTLKTLWLRDAPVTAAGVKALGALSALEFLALQGVPAADAALGALDLPKLEFLNLAQSDITDDGLGKLPVLPKLRNLTLSGLKFTDAGLKHLSKQPSLDNVTLFGTKATKEGAEGLKKLKPKLSVSVLN